MKFLDVSRPIYSKMAVYPGNPETSVKVLRKAMSSQSQLSLISMGSHSGTHVDAHRHIGAKGKAIDATPLSKLCGKAVVLDFRGADSISEKMLAKSKGIRPGVIVLFKTRNSFASKSRFSKDFVFVEEGAAEFLARRRVLAVGVDGPSIDKFHSGTHPAHFALLPRGIPIIEGLGLFAAPAGRCEFFCFPLKIVGGDAAPARAVIMLR